MESGSTAEIPTISILPSLPASLANGEIGETFSPAGVTTVPSPRTVMWPDSSSGLKVPWPLGMTRPPITSAFCATTRISESPSRPRKVTDWILEVGRTREGAYLTRQSALCKPRLSLIKGIRTIRRWTMSEWSVAIVKVVRIKEMSSRRKLYFLREKVLKGNNAHLNKKNVKWKWITFWALNFLV